VRGSRDGSGGVALFKLVEEIAEAIGDALAQYIVIHALENVPKPPLVLSA
jgi:hypothetical protein